MTTWRRFGAGVAVLALLSLVVLGGAPASSDANADGSFAATKTVTRTYLNADGSVTLVDSRNVTVNVSQTTSLRGRQDVQVSWTGAHPTGGIQVDPNSALAPTAEYPMAILECRGTEDGTGANKVDPTTCWTHASASRFIANSNIAFGPWRVDEYASDAQRGTAVGSPSPAPSTCPSIDDSRWVPFVAADGTVYPYGSNGCGGLPPEDFQVDTGNSAVPPNTTFAATGTDGTGTAKFDLWTEAEDASLGCSATVPCTLEVIPIMGVSCDPYGVSPGLSAGNIPDSDAAADAVAQCETTGNYQPGSFATGQSGKQAVSGALWWSASNWRNRIAVPLSFAPVSDACDSNSAGAATSVYGSELMVEATNQWSPKFCSDSSLFKFTHVQTSEPLARSTLQSGSISGAFTSDPPDTPYTVPTVQAPVAVTGFAVSYNIDDENQHPVTNLRMDARLLAKLLTESYGAVVAMQVKGSPVQNNPVNITQDPEFQALNPGISFEGGDPGPASLIALLSQSDVTEAVTAYINADPEARAWLDGKPDPWGMVINSGLRGHQSAGQPLATPRRLHPGPRLGQPL